MAVVYVNPLYPFQVAGGSVQAPSSQLNFRQMLSEVTAWNPDLDPQVAGRFINDAYRQIIDHRSWYGLKVRGQVSVGAPYSTGQVICNSGNPQVIGIGTNWTSALEGYSFRTGFTSAYQGITKVLNPNLLQLDTPFAGSSGTTGYQAVDNLIDFGANIKRLLWAVNQQQGWPMVCNANAESINAWDVWRTNLGWSTHFATRSQSPGGSLILECWPTPASAQAFPFEAFQQPPDMVADSDAPVAWIRSDLIVTRAVADALIFRGRQSKYYDPVVSGIKMKQFESDLEKMVMNDDNMALADVTWSYGGEDDGSGYGQGATFRQMHA